MRSGGTLPGGLEELMLEELFPERDTGPGGFQSSLWVLETLSNSALLSFLIPLVL